MKKQHALIVVVLIVIVLLISSGAQSSKVASSIELNLVRSVLKNVDDDAGRWQHSGGKAYQDGKHAANYASVKRVTFDATSGQNTAMLTITLFFIGQQPPQSITLQGTHDFNSGKQIGSVSAASTDYADYIGGSFTTENKTIRISQP